MLNNPKQLRRLELAIQAIKNSQISFVRKATQSYNVSRTILRDRLKDTQQRILAYCTKRKLTKTKENTFL